jgi:WD40 repeat protein
VDVSLDGRIASSSGKNNPYRSRNPEMIQLWEAATGIRTHVLDGGYGAGRVAFSPDGSLLASVNNRNLRHLKSGKLRRSVRNVKRVHSVAFSHDGLLLAYVSDGKLHILSVRTGSLKRLVENDFVGPVAFSPVDSLVAITSYAGDRLVQVWEVIRDNVRP